MSQWLITGGAGMLGRAVAEMASTAGHHVTVLRRSDLDIVDPAACLSALHGFDVLANCAAWTDVDGAEDHERDAFAANAVGPRNLAIAADRAGAVMMHVSTDYVFAGDGTAPYPVDAPIAPVNAYGRGKAAGEWAVRAECARSFVIRTAWLYGRGGGNFVDTMLRLAGQRDEVHVVDDQRGQPTWTRDLAAELVSLVDGGEHYGTYHGTSAGETTWFGLAQAVFAAAGLDPARVRPTTSDALPRPAARPAYSVLAPHGLHLPDWRESVERYVRTQTGAVLRNHS